MIASSAVNSPILKIITKGMRMTNSGMVWRVSLIGRRKAETASNSEARIPSAAPSANESSTASPQR